MAELDKHHRQKCRKASRNRTHKIAMWHEHLAIEKIECPYYVKRILTPVISSGLEHRMVTLPYKDPVKDGTYLSASLLADILYRKFVLSLPFYRQSEEL